MKKQIPTNDKTAIIKTALSSRLILITLQFISNHLISDHQANVFNYPQSAQNSTIFDRIINGSLDGFLRWDAQYFFHIAKYGYTYENCLAFFPFYPLLVRYISICFYNLGLSAILTYDSVLLILLIGVNVVVFILTALTLYELSNIVVGGDSKDKKFALKSTILFCYNPASVFFTAPYTETLFCYLTFKSMLYCLRYYQRLSGLTRSNGVLNIGFIVYTLIALFFRELGYNPRHYCRTFLKYATAIITTITLCLIPFIGFQLYSYQQFCKDSKIDLDEIVIEHATRNNLRLPGNFARYNQSWCYNRIPLAYSYVQDYYWNVGFFRYYQFKQIPNFLLASPMIYVILTNSFKYLQKYFNSSSMKRIFSLHPIFDGKSRFGLNDGSLVFIVHTFVLTIFCICNIHIQVITRILCSASPVFYWFQANSIQSTKLPLLYYKNWFYCYINCYYLIGTIMFCNFLPWT